MEHNVRAVRPPRQMLPRARPAALASLCVLVCALLSIPGTGAIGIGTTHAPYSGARSATTHSSAVAGCGASQFLKLPAFNALHGVGGWEASVQSKGCPRSIYGAPNVATATASIYVQVPVRIHNLSHTIDANWTASALAMTGIHLVGSCPFSTPPKHGYRSEYCVVSASVQFYAEAYLFDAAGKSVASQAYVPLVSNYSSQANYSYCSARYGCSYSNISSPNSSTNVAVSLAFELRLKTIPREMRGTGPNYLLEMVLVSQTQTEVNGSPAPGYLGSTATASLNLGSSIYGLTLNYLRVT